MGSEDGSTHERQVRWLTISKNIPHNVAKENSPEGLMKVLSDIYKKPSTNNTETEQSSSVHGQPKTRQLVGCTNCGKKGHIKKNCWALHKKEDNRRAGANAVMVDAFVGLIPHDCTPEHNGTYVSEHYEKVYLVDGIPLDIVGQLNDKGHDVNFGGGDWRVTNGYMVVAKGLKRLGNMSDKGMKLMIANGTLPDLKMANQHMCESCILGKHKPVCFPIDGKKKKSENLELSAIDLAKNSVYHSQMKHIKKKYQFNKINVGRWSDGA
ncbi:unnamed protein product [Arabidopsis thaliana]|uniref:(thale cress) hypothetical protein n=1 Tax=Arabidopsis thaliana TaxID=3702 RepID=A0A7G2EMG1_ARATH|nr:unnamed protein product [Arabidopsis thaliana]